MCVCVFVCACVAEASWRGQTKYEQDQESLLISPCKRKKWIGKRERTRALNIYGGKHIGNEKFNEDIPIVNGIMAK